MYPFCIICLRFVVRLDVQKAQILFHSSGCEQYTDFTENSEQIVKTIFPKIEVLFSIWYYFKMNFNHLNFTNICCAVEVSSISLWLSVRFCTYCRWVWSVGCLFCLWWGFVGLLLFFPPSICFLSCFLLPCVQGVGSFQLKWRLLI